MIINISKFKNTSFVIFILLLIAGLNFKAVAIEAQEYKKFTSTGNYLAGQHAHFNKENALAADFLLSALKQSPENNMLRHKVFLILLMEGKIGKALDLGRKLIEKGSKTDLLRLLNIVNQKI